MFFKETTGTIGIATIEADDARSVEHPIARLSKRHNRHLATLKNFGIFIGDGAGNR